MNKIIIVIQISFFLGGCSATKKNIVGNYMNYENFEVSAEIDLLENNRFNFSAQQGLMFFGTKGTWELIDGQILLNSDTSLIDSSSFQFTTPAKQDSIYINVYSDNEKLPGAKIDIFTKTDTTEFRTDIDGFAKIPCKNIQSLKVDYIYLLPVRIEISKENLININVFMTEEIPGNMKFENEKWLAKSNKLVEINKHTNRKIVYKKSR